MAGERVLPGLGIKAFWTPGSDGWDVDHDTGTRTLSIMVQARVIDIVTSLPGSPTDGDIYILTDGGAHDQAIAARDNGSWVYIEAAEGFEVYNLADHGLYRYNGTAWAVVLAGPADTDGLTEGAANLYFTVSRVLASVLTGLSAGSNTPIAATDTLLTALENLQAQIDAGAGGPATTDDLTEGTTNLYFTAARVRSTVLTGLASGTNTAITASDTILAALANLQAQITAGSAGPADTDALSEGTTNLYFTAARVRSTALTGLAAGSNTAITTSDTILAALANLQAQITAEASITGKPFELMVAVGDETTPHTTGTAKVTFRMPRAVTLSAVKASVTTAPTGAALQIDVNKAGSTIFSANTKIDAGSKTSVGGSQPGTLSTTAIAADDEMTIDIDTVGSTVAGAGLKVTLLGVYQ